MVYCHLILSFLNFAPFPPLKENIKCPLFIQRNEAIIMATFPELLVHLQSTSNDHLIMTKTLYKMKPVIVLLYILVIQQVFSPHYKTQNQQAY